MDSIWLTVAEISLVIGAGCSALMWLFADDSHDLQRERLRGDMWAREAKAWRERCDDVGHAASVLGRHNAATAKAKRAAFHAPMIAKFMPGSSL